MHGDPGISLSKYRLVGKGVSVEKKNISNMLDWVRVEMGIGLDALRFGCFSV
jgi:hypothetical protein